MSDLISRQAAIDYVDDVPYIKDHPNIGLLWKAWVEQLPSVEPKRETTTLRIGRTMNSVIMWYECAECGEPVDQEDAFCRRCGRGIIHE